MSRIEDLSPLNRALLDRLINYNSLYHRIVVVHDIWGVGIDTDGLLKHLQIQRKWKRCDLLHYTFGRASELKQVAAMLGPCVIEEAEYKGIVIEFKNSLQIDHELIYGIYQGYIPCYEVQGTTPTFRCRKFSIDTPIIVLGQTLPDCVDQYKDVYHIIRPDDPTLFDCPKLLDEELWGFPLQDVIQSWQDLVCSIGKLHRCPIDSFAAKCGMEYEFIPGRNNLKLFVCRWNLDYFCTGSQSTFPVIVELWDYDKTYKNHFVEVAELTKQRRNDEEQAWWFKALGKSESFTSYNHDETMLWRRRLAYSLINPNRFATDNPHMKRIKHTVESTKTMDAYVGRCIELFDHRVTYTSQLSNGNETIRYLIKENKPNLENICNLLAFKTKTKTKTQTDTNTSEHGHGHGQDFTWTFRPSLEYNTVYLIWALAMDQVRPWVRCVQEQKLLRHHKGELDVI